MRFQIDYFRQFLRDSAGAISVDYVMLAAGVTAATLLSSGILQEGMRALAGTVDSELKGEAPDSRTSLSYSNGFDNGSQGWTGADISTVAGLGTVLGPIGGSNGEPTVSRDFQFEEGTEEASFEFDLFALDSLDNESGIIYVNGREIGRVTSNHGNATFTAAEGLDPDQVIIRSTVVDNRVQLGGSDRFNDHHSQIRITLGNPGTNVNFGFGSTANQNVGDESFAIDNFTVTSTAPRGGAGTGGEDVSG